MQTEIHKHHSSTDLCVGQRVEGHDNIANRVFVLTLLSQQCLKTYHQNDA